MRWSDDNKVLNVYEEVKTFLEIEGVFLPDKLEELLKKRAKGEISRETFQKEVLKIVNERS